MGVFAAVSLVRFDFGETRLQALDHLKCERQGCVDGLPLPLSIVGRKGGFNGLQQATGGAFVQFRNGHP
jgi:hypothetical protein